MQSKKRSLTEAVINTLIGFVISFTGGMFFYSLCGVKVSNSQNFILTILYTFLSIGRGYLIRRFFNKADALKLQQQ